jgi:uncharacterized protein with von Willebrand factor type A (vWA) domain
MTRPLSDLIIEFVAGLRAAGVRISVAESLDAMRAIGVAGLAMPRMREALRAALIKDEADNPIFNTLFASYFRGPPHDSDPNRKSRGMRTGVIGGQGESSAAPSELPASKPTAGKGVQTDPTEQDEPEERSTAPGRASDSADPGDSSEDSIEDGSPEEATAVAGQGSSPEHHDDRDHRGPEATLANLRRIERFPFAGYSPLEYDQARDALAILRRRWQTRLGRRLRRARRGRLDFRRTIRASLQHGGLPLERHFRARRPRHLDLVVLADISGSVHYASLLILELLAGAAREFRRMRGFVFIDRLAAAEFEQGHLVMTPRLDMYARSDFGRVFGEIESNYRDILNRTTVMVILGDGRNNKRPPRTDLLRTIANRCRTVVWLNPEPPERWGTGDSAIESYRRVVDFLLPCGSLRELQASLVNII